MKYLLLTIIAFSLFSCSDNSQPLHTEYRPQSEVTFLNKVNEFQQAYHVKQNANHVQSKIDAFHKYVVDSLMEVKEWAFILEEINEDFNKSNSIIRRVANSQDKVCNVALYSLIDINSTADTVSKDNVVNFTGSLVVSDKTKSVIDQIKTLSPGDTVLASGSIAHLDNRLQPDFSDIIKNNKMPWNVDIVLTSIRKK